MLLHQESGPIGPSNSVDDVAGKGRHEDVLYQATLLVCTYPMHFSLKLLILRLSYIASHLQDVQFLGPSLSVTHLRELAKNHYNYVLHRYGIL